jgi:hypothetical protein
VNGPQRYSWSPAATVFWRTEAACVVIAGPTGVIRLIGDFATAWQQIICGAEADGSLSPPTAELLEELKALGYVHLGVNARDAWRSRELGHLPRLG